MQLVREQESGFVEGNQRPGGSRGALWAGLTTPGPRALLFGARAHLDKLQISVYSLHAENQLEPELYSQSIVVNLIINKNCVDLCKIYGPYCEEKFHFYNICHTTSWFAVQCVQYTPEGP